MRYTRIYADTDGNSHFEDVAIEIEPIDFAPPAPPVHLSEPTEVKRSMFICLPEGWFGGWHPAPARQFYFCLSGELEVEISDGTLRRFPAGSAVLLEDVSGKGHKTRVISSTDAYAAVVQCAEQ